MHVPKRAQLEVKTPVLWFQRVYECWQTSCSRFYLQIYSSSSRFKMTPESCLHLIHFTYLHKGQIYTKGKFISLVVQVKPPGVTSDFTHNTDFHIFIKFNFISPVIPVKPCRVISEFVYLCPILYSIHS